MSSFGRTLWGSNSKLNLSLMLLLIIYSLFHAISTFCRGIDTQVLPVMALVVILWQCIFWRSYHASQLCETEEEATWLSDELRQPYSLLYMQIVIKNAALKLLQLGLIKELCDLVHSKQKGILRNFIVSPTQMHQKFWAAAFVGYNCPFCYAISHSLVYSLVHNSE